MVRDNKGKLGANAMLAVSMAVAKAAAEEVWPSSFPLHWWYKCKNIAYTDDEHLKRWCTCR